MIHSYPETMRLLLINRLWYSYKGYLLISPIKIIYIGLFTAYIYATTTKLFFPPSRFKEHNQLNLGRNVAKQCTEQGICNRKYINDDPFRPSPSKRFQTCKKYFLLYSIRICLFGLPRVCAISLPTWPHAGR